jgi:selenophosphate synthase
VEPKKKNSSKRGRRRAKKLGWRVLLTKPILLTALVTAFSEEFIMPHRAFDPVREMIISVLQNKSDAPKEEIKK